MIKYVTLIYMTALLCFAGVQAASATPVTTRIKDIVDIEGVRDNMLVGYGLVVGLNGTGDSLKNSPFTEQSLIAMLERLGVNVRGQSLNTGNVAAVMVTATLPPFTNQGARIDVSVSALGDAKNLQGGTLLVTPLMAADGQVYAVSQGPLIISGFTASGDAAKITQNTPTQGHIPEGALVEREIDFKLADLQHVRLSLKNPDLTTARRIARAINGFLSDPIAEAENSASVVINRPKSYPGTTTDLLTDIETLPVQPDQIARVVINENSGVIVIGENVRISTAAIAQGNLTIKISESPQVSQPSPFSDGGETKVVPRTDVSVNTGKDVRLGVLDTGVTLQELVTGLNRMGISPRDVIAILQALKASGAMQADITTM